jgi:hypothetical protein
MFCNDEIVHIFSFTGSRSPVTFKDYQKNCPNFWEHCFFRSLYDESCTFTDEIDTYTLDKWFAEHFRSSPPFIEMSPVLSRALCELRSLPSSIVNSRILSRSCRIQGTQLLFSNAYSHVDLDGPITVTCPSHYASFVWAMPCCAP